MVTTGIPIQHRENPGTEMVWKSPWKPQCRLSIKYWKKTKNHFGCYTTRPCLPAVGQVLVTQIFCPHPDRKYLQQSARWEIHRDASPSTLREYLDNKAISSNYGKAVTVSPKKGLSASRLASLVPAGGGFQTGKYQGWKLNGETMNKNTLGKTKKIQNKTPHHL